MKKFCSLMILALLLCIPSKTYGQEFSDIEEDHWAKAYIMSLSQEEIIAGYPDGTFRPDRYVSLLEALSIIEKIKKPDQKEIQVALKHYGKLVDSYNISPWARNAFAYALDKNIIYYSELAYSEKNGYLSDDPDLKGAYPKREDLAVYFARALELAPSYDHSNLQYKDLDQIGSALGNDLEIADYLAALVDAKIFDPKGSEGYFEADRPFRRAELCKIADLSLKYLADNN
ncbi:MAG: S-layer homology domain-containing protein [Bacillota bacterium]|nr:S-layer homology domain-containing protein [Bacillota bacterium]